MALVKAVSVSEGMASIGTGGAKVVDRANVVVATRAPELAIGGNASEVGVTTAVPGGIGGGKR
jgi:hypothetical protein